LKVKENIYTLYSNTNRNTMMEKTTLQLIRKVEEKNQKNQQTKLRVGQDILNEFPRILKANHLYKN